MSPQINHKEKFQKGVFFLQEPDCVTEDAYEHLPEPEKIYTDVNLYYTMLYRDCMIKWYNCTVVPFRLANETTSKDIVDGA